MPLVDVRGFNLTPDILGGVQQGVNIAGGIQNIQQRQGQFDRAAQIRQLLGQAGQAAPQTEQQQQLAAQSAGLGGPQALAEQPQALLSQDELITRARAIDPIIAEQALKAAGLDDPTRRAEASRFAAQLQSVPFESRANMINTRAQSLQSQGRDPKDTLQLLDMDEAQQNQAITGVQLLDLSTKERFAVRAEREKTVRGPLSSAGQREFEALIEDFSPEDKKTARRVKAGLKGRATGSALQTIAEEGTALKVSKVKSLIEGAVVEARIIAKDKGETFTNLVQARAALPGLNTVVDKLRELAPIATSTLGGKIFNAAVKESGFGGTKGATARAKFIAIINSQVLPLLKPTFGAAFTVQEGEALKATMGDPDASPEEKMAQLDSFIEQKMRDIETKESALNPPEAAPELPEGVTEEDITETMRANSMTRQQVLDRLGGR
jgi:hypothetical protein